MLQLHYLEELSQQLSTAPGNTTSEQLSLLGEVSHQSGACLTDTLAAAQAEKKKLKILRIQVSCSLSQSYKR